MSQWTLQNDRPELTLAAIRWYATSIEKLATGLYITNRADYPALKTILAAAYRELVNRRGHCPPRDRPQVTPLARPSASELVSGEKGKGTQLSKEEVERLEALKPKVREHEVGEVIKPKVAEPETRAIERPHHSSQHQDCPPGYVMCDGLCVPECEQPAEY